MKITSMSNKWEHNTDADINQISVDAQGMGKMISLISKNIYSHEGSPFREYWLNARESHQAAKAAGHKSISPMEITLPLTEYSTWVNHDDVRTEQCNKTTIVSDSGTDNGGLFTIRDYGIGLNREDLKNMISRAGASTKDKSDEYGGGMGIGTLSGFFVSDQIMFTAYKDGKENTIILSSENSSWTILDENDTTEPNGLKVSMVIDSGKRPAFTRGAMSFITASGCADDMTVRYSPYYINGIQPHDIREAGEKLAANGGSTTPTGMDVSMSALNETENSWVYDPVKNNPDNFTIRIDGCFYEGVTQNTRKIIKQSVIESMKKTWGDDIVDILNESHIEDLMNPYSSFHYSSAYYFSAIDDTAENSANSITRGVNTQNIIVDAPVGRFNNSIQPSRESITLTKEDTKEIIDAAVQGIEEDLQNMAPVMKAYKKIHSQDNTVDVYVSFLEACEKLESTHPHLLGCAAYIAKTFATTREDMFTVPSIPRPNTVSRTCRERELTSSTGTIRGDYQNVGYMSTDMADGKIALFAITKILKSSGSSYYNRVDARMMVSYMDAFTPEDIIVVESKRQKDTIDEIRRLMEIANNRDELHEDLCVEDCTFEGKKIIVNTPYMKKIMSEDETAVAGFTNTSELDGVETVGFSEFLKTTGLNKMRTTKSTTPTKTDITYPVSIFNPKGDGYTWEADSIREERTMDDLAEILKDEEVVFIVDSSNQASSWEHYASETIAPVGIIKDAKKIIVVSLTPSRRYDTLMKRLEKVGVTSSRVTSSDGYKDALWDHFFNKMSTEQFKVACAMRTYSKCYNILHAIMLNVEKVEECGEILTALGLKDFYNTVKPFVCEGFLPSDDQNVYNKHPANLTDTHMLHILGAPGFYRMPATTPNARFASALSGFDVGEKMDEVNVFRNVDKEIFKVFEIVNRYGGFKNTSVKDRVKLLEAIHSITV